EKDNVVPKYSPIMEERQTGNGGAAEERLRGNGRGAEERPIPEDTEDLEFPEVPELPEVPPSRRQEKTRFAQTRETLDPKEQPLATFLEGIDDDDEPLPPVHFQPSETRVIPPAALVAKIVNRAGGHRFIQTTNGQKCIACKT